MFTFPLLYSYCTHGLFQFCILYLCGKAIKLYNSKWKTIKAQLRVMILINESVMSSSTCFLISIYGIFAMNMQSLLALFIGIDRVYVIVYPGK